MVSIAFGAASIGSATGSTLPGAAEAGRIMLSGVSRDSEAPLRSGTPGGEDGGPTDSDSDPSIPGTAIEAAVPNVLMPISAAACAIVAGVGAFEVLLDELPLELPPEDEPEAVFVAFDPEPENELPP